VNIEQNGGVCVKVIQLDIIDRTVIWKALKQFVSYVGLVTVNYYL